MYCLNNQISLLIQVAITNENHYLVYQCIGTGGSDCALSIDWLIKTNTTLWARSPRTCAGYQKLPNRYRTNGLLNLLND